MRWQEPLHCRRQADLSLLIRACTRLHAQNHDLDFQKPVSGALSPAFRIELIKRVNSFAAWGRSKNPSSIDIYWGERISTAGHAASQATLGTPVLANAVHADCMASAIT